MKELEILYDKEEICPICNTKFSTKKVRNSRLRLTGRDEDFLSYYNAFNDISETNKEKVRENISSRWKKKKLWRPKRLRQGNRSLQIGINKF